MQRAGAAVAAIERWAALAGGAVPVALINQFEMTGDVPVDKLDVADLRSLPGLGIEVGVRVETQGWTARFDAPPSGVWRVRLDDEVELVVPNSEAEAYRDAATQGDIAAVLEPLQGATAAVKLTFEHPARDAGFHWIASASDLEERLTGGTWLATLRQLFEKAGPHTVVLHDAGDGYVVAPAVVVCGPAADVTEAQAEDLTEGRRRFQAERGRSDDPLPTPRGLAPTSSHGLGSIEKLMNGVARAASWYWLAREVPSAGVPPVVRFVGARLADVQLTVSASDSAEAELALYDWALPGADPLQDEAVQQAAALAIFEPDDLDTAAAPVLRNAQTILRGLRKDEVSEALATQREVRESAIKAGAAAAEAGRSAGAKVVERVILQSAAAAGILIANLKNAIPNGTTQLLLLLVLCLIALSAVLAFLVEYPMANGALESFKKDVDLHRDTLGAEARKEIKNMDALKKASSTIDRSFWTSVCVFALAAIVLGAALLCLA